METLKPVGTQTSSILHVKVKLKQFLTIKFTLKTANSFWLSITER